jgi:thioredoxin 1
MNSLLRICAKWLALMLCFAGAAIAEPIEEAFTKARFDALQAQDALILVDIYAPWCPTCARQQKILTAYQQERTDARLHWLKVDFDNDKTWVKAFRAPRQGTLLLYRGTKQAWFSVAETRREKIFAALNAAAGIQP